MQDLIFDNSKTDDILIDGGDLVIYDSTLQHQYDLLKSKKGDWLFNPTCGVDAESFLDDEKTVSDLFRAIKIEFERDGMKVNSIYINEKQFYFGTILAETIQIDALYS